MRSTMVSWHLRGHEGPTLTYGVYWGNDLYHPWDAMIPLTNEIANVLVTTTGIWPRLMTFCQWGNCVDSVVLVYCVRCEHVNSHSLWWWDIGCSCMLLKELVNSLNQTCCVVMLVIVPGMCDRVCVAQQGPRLHCMVTSSPARYHNLT